MPVLNDPIEVAARIGLQVNGRAPGAAEPRLRAMIEMATTRIEGILNTQLRAAAWTDTFTLEPRFCANTEVFRLSAGFLDPTSVVVTDPYGDVVNSDRYRVDALLGSVTVSRPRHGDWTVSYSAGFTVDSSDPPVYQNTPDWLRNAVDVAALSWHRVVNADKTPNTVSLSALMNAVYRELAAQVYGKYERPRSPAHFPVHAVRTDV